LSVTSPACPDEHARPRPEPAITTRAARDRIVAAAVQDGARRYFAACRARVPAFARATFGLRGALGIHRRALGWDLARAPLNLLLTPPQLALGLGAALLARLGARRAAALLRNRHLLLETDVAREVARRVRTELLRLPATEGGSPDALLEEILADPALRSHLAASLESSAATAADFQRRLAAAMLAYAGTRPAASEIAAGLMTTGVGALTVKQLTPGALTLGPLIAALIARQAAVASFPLGAALGGVWYRWFPPAPPWPLVAAITVGLLAAIAALASVAGIVLDPLQLALGLHQRRLHRLIDAIERHFADADATGFVARDHYAARVLDLVDLIASAHRLAGL
jgi:hypothetical protein